MAATNDLGMYLGIPFIHGRPNKGHFKHVTEKNQRKLAGWKAKVFSLSGQATLVQFVTSTIPNYTSHVLKMPVSICADIDKINRIFLWGDTNEKNKVHLVKWKKVCTPKSKGGLGIRSCGINNRAMVSKLGWRLMNEDNPLWIKVLKKKYNLSNNPREWSSKTKASPVWRSIFSSKELLEKNTKWTIGNGGNVSLWFD